MNNYELLKLAKEHVTFEAIYKASKELTKKASVGEIAKNIAIGHVKNKVNETKEVVKKLRETDGKAAPSIGSSLRKGHRLSKTIEQPWKAGKTQAAVVRNVIGYKASRKGRFAGRLAGAATRLAHIRHDWKENRLKNK